MQHLNKEIHRPLSKDGLRRRLSDASLARRHLARRQLDHPYVLPKRKLRLLRHQQATDLMHCVQFESDCFRESVNSV